jgi:hypothetical protein
VALVLALIAIALAVAVLLTRGAKRPDRTARSLELFGQLAAERGLSEGETGRLRELLQHEPGAPPHTVFQSMPLFERCLDQEVRGLLAAAPSLDRRGSQESMLASLRAKLGYAVVAPARPLISTRNVDVGQTGSLLGREGENPLVQHATVVENGEFFLRVKYDPRQEGPMGSFAGAELRFSFPRAHDGYYTVPLAVASHDPSGLVTFYHGLQLQRNQVRQHVRVDIDMPLQVHPLAAASPETPAPAAPRSVAARTADISGGGLTFVCAVAFHPGDQLSFSFALPRASFTAVRGKVLRVGTQRVGSGTFYRHHVEFTAVEPGERAAIAAYVLSRMRELYRWR